MTDIEHHPYSPDVKLVTPKRYELCPDCHEKGYNQRSGGTNSPPRRASLMPQDSADLPRQIERQNDLVPVGTSIKPSASGVSPIAM